MCKGVGAWPLRDLDHGDEEDGADAVIEERLTGQLCLDFFGDTDTAQHLEDGDGIGGREERAKEKAFDPRNVTDAADAHERGDQQETEDSAGQGKKGNG